MITLVLVSQSVPWTKEDDSIIQRFGSLAALDGDRSDACRFFAREDARANPKTDAYERKRELRLAGAHR